MEEEVRGRLLLHDGREVELTSGADVVMGRGGSRSALPLGIDDKRCSRRQAVLTFLPPGSPGDPPFALVAHGSNATRVRRHGTGADAGEWETMTRGEVYFLHDGDVIGLPPDYQPIVLCLVAVADCGRSRGGSASQQQTEMMEEETMEPEPVGHVMEVKESQQYADDVFTDTGRRRWNRTAPSQRAKEQDAGEPDHGGVTVASTTAAVMALDPGRLETRTMQDDGQDAEGGASQEERAQSEGGGLLGLLPNYRSLTMWWQTGGEAAGQQSEAATSSEAETTVRSAAEAAAGGWIRRKRKSDDVTTATGRSSSHNGDLAREEAIAHEAEDEAGQGDERLAKKMRRTDADRCSPPDEEEQEEKAEERTEAPASADDSVLLLKSMFGDMEERELCKVLVENGGDVNQAIDSLLNLVAIRNGEAGSLSLAEEDVPAGPPPAAEEGRSRATHTTTTVRGDDAVGRREDEGDMEWSEGDEGIVDSMKDAIVEALAESYLRKRETRTRHDDDDDEDDGDDGGERASVDWPCPVCTFINSAADDECLMCGHSHESSRERPSEEALVRDEVDARAKGKEKMEEEEKDDGDGDRAKVAPEEERKLSEEELREEEERKLREETERRREVERQRRDKLDKEDEAKDDMSPGWGVRKGIPAHQQQLYINSQALTVLPRQVGRFKRLTMLNLDHNAIEWLPAEIGELTSLQGLYISHNQLKNLPPELGKLTNLVWLRVNHNELEELDDALAGLTGLQHLELTHNRLKQFPSWLNTLPLLKLLDLSHNQIAHLDPTLFVDTAQPAFASRPALYLVHNPLRCVPYALRHAIEAGRLELEPPSLAGCKFDELERSEWTKTAGRSDHCILRREEGAAAVVSLFDQCLTYLYRTEKESIDDWGLPEQITSYLWRHINLCAGCALAFVGKGVCEVIEIWTWRYTRHHTPHSLVPVRSHYCSLSCAPPPTTTTTTTTTTLV